VNRREHLATWAVASAGWVLPARAAAVPAAPGEPVRWPEVTLLDGSRFGPDQASGQAMVVVFWSIGCPFCRRHNPRVEKLHRAAVGRPLRVLGVARERDLALVRAHVQAQGYSFPNTLDTRPLADALSQRRLIPLTVTVDRQGRLKQVIPGEMSEDDMLGLLELAA
jgi:thiol-disulfide isomerase/thioredoxin